jgi:hypothetical protein
MDNQNNDITKEEATIETSLDSSQSNNTSQNIGLEIEPNNESTKTTKPINNNTEIPGTTLLLTNNNKKNKNQSNKNLYKIGVYIILAVIFGYFITKTDNNKYKIGLITGFVLVSTFLFNKYFKEPIESQTVIDDNGSNLIEG